MSDEENSDNEYVAGDESEEEPVETVDSEDEANDGESSEEKDVDEPDDSVDLKSVSEYNKEIIVIKPENRKFSQILSKYEMTELVSIRATQISQYNNCMVDITGLDDPIAMAQRELRMRKCPIMVRRTAGDIKDASGEVRTYVEDWDPNFMQFAVDYWAALSLDRRFFLFSPSLRADSRETLRGYLFFVFSYC